MLKSNNKISYSEVIDNIEDLLGLLIDKELDNIGRLSATRVMEYLQDKTNISFSSVEKSNMDEVYMLRNIIAHGTGMVRQSLKESLPNYISINNDEIQVEKKYLEMAMKRLYDLVDKIEDHVTKKFLEHNN